MSIKILNIGFGNAPAVADWILECGIVPSIISDNDFSLDDLVIIPGVGSVEFVHRRLKELNLDKSLLTHMGGTGKVIGICAGMQVMGRYLEEADGQGLGEIHADVIANAKGRNTGWTDIILERDGLPDFWQRGFGRKQKLEGRIYSNHNFSYSLDEVSNAAQYSYVKDETVQIIATEHFLGMQFHPEKSQVLGHQLAKLVVNSYAYRG